MAEGLVDWGLAERVAGALSGSGPGWSGTDEELRTVCKRAQSLERGLDVDLSSGTEGLT